MSEPIVNRRNIQALASANNAIRQQIEGLEREVAQLKAQLASMQQQLQQQQQLLAQSMAARGSGRTA